MIKEFVCIQCPLGCPLTVRIEDGAVISVTGNTCKKGLVYAQQEAVAPLRMVTSLVEVTGRLQPVSVKTTKGVPRDAISQVLAVLSQMSVVAPVKIGDVLVEDVANTGVQVVATCAVL